MDESKSNDSAPGWQRLHSHYYQHHPKIWKAVSTGDLKKVRKALANPATGEDVFYCDAVHLRSLLYRATSLGFTEIAKALLADPRTDPNLPQRRGDTPLFVAAKKGHADMVELLLADPRVDPNQPNVENATPIYVASENGHTEIVRRLLRVPKVNPATELLHLLATPLYAASQNGHPGVVKELLQHRKVSVNACVAWGNTALHAACYHGHAVVAEILLQQPGVLVNKGNDEGATPFLLACQEGHLEVVSLLLQDQRVDVQSAMEGWVTPLWSACRHGFAGVVRVLLEDGRVEVNSPDEAYDASPLWVACQNGSADVVRELLKAPSLKVHRPDRKGVTPVHAAIKAGHLEVLKVLFASPFEFPLGGWISKELAANAETHPEVFFLVSSYQLYPDSVRKMLALQEKGESKEERELKECLERERLLIERVKVLDHLNSVLQIQVLSLRKRFQSSCFPDGICLPLQEILEATGNFDVKFSKGETPWSLVFQCLLTDVPVEVHMLNPDLSVSMNSASLNKALQFLQTEEISRKLRPLLGHTELASNVVCLVYQQEKNGSVSQALTSTNPPTWDQRLKIIQSLISLAEELQTLNLSGKLPGTALPTLKAAYLDQVTDEVTFCGFGLLMASWEKGLEAPIPAEKKPLKKKKSLTCSTKGLRECEMVYSLGISIASLLTGKQDDTLVDTIMAAMPLKASLFPRDLLDPALKDQCQQDCYRTLAQIMRSCLESSSSKRPFLSEMAARVQSLSEDNHQVCVVCMENPPNVILTCGHFVVCGSCAESLLSNQHSCPLCRGELRGFKLRLPKTPKSATQSESP